MPQMKVTLTPEARAALGELQASRTGSTRGPGATNTFGAIISEAVLVLAHERAPCATDPQHGVMAVRDDDGHPRCGACWDVILDAMEAT